MPAGKVNGCLSGVFIVNFEHILAIDLVFSLLISCEYPGLPQTSKIERCATTYQLTFTCSNSTVETLEKGVKHLAG